MTKDTIMNDATNNKDDDDKNMTPEERMAWLRERGIEVVTPEERKAEAAAAASGVDEEGETERITYIRIPCDTSKPIEELAVNVASKATNDALVEHLKSRFQEKTDQVDLSLLDQQSQQNSLLSSGGGDIPTISQSTLDKVAREGHVETFTLLNPAPANNYTSVNMYLDEAGMLKRLPINTRANEYAAKAGYNPAPTFYGDVYMGKTKLGGGISKKNVSMTIQDADPNAPWLINAATTNIQHQLEKNKLTGNTDVTQPGVLGADGNAAQEDSYSWTQTEEEIEVRIVLPSQEESTTTKAIAKKQIKVQFKPQSFDVSYCKKPLLHMFKLFEKVDVDSCTWTLEEDNKSSLVLVLSMEKVDAAYWPRIRD